MQPCNEYPQDENHNCTPCLSEMSSVKRSAMYTFIVCPEATSIQARLLHHVVTRDWMQNITRLRQVTYWFQWNQLKLIQANALYWPITQGYVKYITRLRQVRCLVSQWGSTTKSPWVCTVTSKYLSCYKRCKTPITNQPTQRSMTVVFDGFRRYSTQLAVKVWILLHGR